MIRKIVNGSGRDLHLTQANGERLVIPDGVSEKSVSVSQEEDDRLRKMPGISVLEKLRD